MLYLNQKWEHVCDVVKIFYARMKDAMHARGIACEYIDVCDIPRLTENDVLISDIRAYVPRIGGVHVHKTVHKIIIINAELFTTFSGSYLHFMDLILKSGRCLKYYDYSAFNYATIAVIRNPPLRSNADDIVKRVLASQHVDHKQTFGLMYHPSLELPESVKDIDVLFCGNISPRRQLVLDDLKTKLPHLTFCIQSFVDIDEYFEYVKRSRVCVIVSRFAFCEFDMYRSTIMICNNVYCVHEVLNEVSVKTKQYKNLERIVDFSPTQEFAERIDTFLKMSDSEQRALCEQRKTIFKEDFDMDSRFDEIVSSLPA